MRLLDRYVAGQFLKTVGVCAIGVPLLFMVIDLADHLNTYIDQGTSRWHVALHYIYQFPYQSFLGAPIAVLLGSAFTISSMTRRSEITAIKAGGVSFYRICAPLLVLSVVLSLVGLALTEVIAVTTRKAAEVLEQEENRSQSIRQHFVYRESDGYVYKVRHLDAAEMRMEGVQIERKGTGPGFPTMHVSAATAQYDSASSQWALQDGWIHRFLGPDRETSYQFQEVFLRQLDESPEDLQARPKEPDEMRYEELGRLIEAVERSGGSSNALRTGRAFRVAHPFSMLVIVVFGMPLAYSSRRGGAPTAIGIALGTMIIFMTLARVAEAIGAGGALSPAVAAWLPNAFFLALGLVFMARIRT